MNYKQGLNYICTTLLGVDPQLQATLEVHTKCACWSEWTGDQEETIFLRAGDKSRKVEFYEFMQSSDVPDGDWPEVFEVVVVGECDYDGWHDADYMMLKMRVKAEGRRSTG